MSKRRFSASALWIVAILTLSVGIAIANDGVKATGKTDTNVQLKGPTLEAVVDRLFGTPDNGLLDGTSHFEFRAEDMVLTSSQSADFFTSSTISTEDFVDLIKATEALHGIVRLEGTIDSTPFELKISGHQLKLEGLTLTSAQRDALIAGLRTLPDLHEMKIEAFVDGKLTVTKVERGHEKIELLERRRDNRDRQERSGDHGKPERPQRIEIERPVKPELHDRIEHIERIEVREKLERLEIGRR